MPPNLALATKIALVYLTLCNQIAYSQSDTQLGELKMSIYIGKGRILMPIYVDLLQGE